MLPSSGRTFITVAAGQWRAALCMPAFILPWPQQLAMVEKGARPFAAARFSLQP